MEMETETSLRDALKKRDKIPGQDVFWGENAIELSLLKEFLETRKWGIISHIISMLIRTNLTAVEQICE
jgi:hypothetical protein